MANRQAINEIPREQIIEASKSHPMVSLKIKRTGGGGMWATLKGNPFAMDTDKMVDMDVWLQEQFGGGTYHVEARVANNPAEIIELIPPFMVRVEGVPKVSALPERHPMTGFADNSAPLDPTTGRAVMTQNRPSDFMTSTPDAIAMEVLSKREQELVQEKQLREAERKANDARYEAQQKVIQDLQKQASEADNRRERAILEAKLEQATRQHQPPPPEKKVDWAATLPLVATAIGAVTPVIVALIDSGKERNKQMVEQQTKTLDTQLNMQTQLMTTLAGNKAADPLAGVVTLIGTLAPVAAPLIKQFFDARSPDKVAELVSTMADNNLSQLSMLKQFLDPLLQQEDNPLVGFLQQGIGSLIETAQHMVKASQQPEKKAPPPQQRVINARSGGGNGNGNGHTLEADDATASYFVNLIRAAPNVPAELKTPEWLGVLHDLHTFTDAADVAKVIATHLAAQVDSNTLPPFFAAIFSGEGGVNPSQVLGQFLAGLPVASINADYVQSVLNEFDALFNESPQAEVVA